MERIEKVFMVTVDSKIETVEQYNDAHTWLSSLLIKPEYGGMRKGKKWREEADWIIGKIEDFEKRHPNALGLPATA